MTDIEHIDQIREVVWDLARRPDVRSISCALRDFELWEGLLKLQVARGTAAQVAPQEALRLMGPDSGIPGITAVYCGLEDGDEVPIVYPDAQGRIASDLWGGEIHIPYEGACSGDVYIPPKGFIADPRIIFDPESKHHFMLRKRSNFVFSPVDYRECVHAIRTQPVPGWWLYENRRPYVNCAQWLDTL